MDTSTGKLYESAQAARDSGVVEGNIVPVSTFENGQALRVMSGPFKGRVYEVINGTRGKRLRHLEG